MDKYFYFRTQATIGDDDDKAQSLMVPVSKLRGITEKRLYRYA